MTQSPPDMGTALLYGSKIRLFVCPDQQSSPHGAPGYVASYFLGTELPPSLIIQQSTLSANSGLSVPYTDLIQSIYFVLVDPSDPNIQIRKQVRFGDQFLLIPYNATTGQEITATFDAISSTKFRENRFTFTQSTTATNQSLSLGPRGAGNLNAIIAQQQVDKIVRYGISNSVLTLIKQPKDPKKNPNAILAPIEFVKDRSASPTNGYLQTKSDAPEKDKKTGNHTDEVSIKPLILTIRSADEALITMQLYGAECKDNKDSKAEQPLQASAKHGKLLNTLDIHAMNQHYPLFDGEQSEFAEKTLIVKLRDIGSVTVPLSTIPTPPLNYLYNKIAPPTTRDEYLDIYGGEDPAKTAVKHPESIIRNVQVHGSQLTVDVPIRVTRIESASNKQPFSPGTEHNTSFKKLDPPQPSLLLCFLAFFLLAWRVLIGLESGIFSITDVNNLHEYIQIARFVGPTMFLAFIAISYPSLYRNVGHSLNYRNTTPVCRYIVEVLPLLDASTHKEVILAYPVPSPFLAKNREKLGFASATLIESPQLITTGANNSERVSPTSATSRSRSSNSNNAIVLQEESKKQPIVSMSSTSCAPQDYGIQKLLAYNEVYQKYLKIESARSAITPNTLTLFQRLDAIRSSAYVSEANTSQLQYTFSATTINQLDKTINEIPDNMTLKASLKSVNALGVKSPQVESLRKFDMDLSYTISSPHKTVGEATEIKLYYPFLFKAIRETHGVSTQDFINAWTFDITNLPSSGTGAGRSGAQFMRSSCEKYIYKTMSQMDMDTLHAVIRDYASYITQNPSLLMRIFGVYRMLDKDGKKLYFLIANNVFYLPPSLSTYKLNARYDLKGRTPKRDVEDRRTAPDAGVFKDLQLSRVFVLHGSTRDQIISNLHGDCQWLKAHDCIDYSLLVGVAENQDFNLQLNECGFQSTTPTSNIPVNVKDHQVVGIPPYVKAQDDTAEIFQVAIVDFLARFNNAMKKTAHAMKSLRWTDDELSTVNSSFYSDRLNNYVKVVFPPNNSVLVRTSDDLKQYFAQETAKKLNLQVDAPEVVHTVSSAMQKLPENANKALLPGSRSPGTMIVDSNGTHIVILPKGVETAPRSLVERSKLQLIEDSKMGFISINLPTSPTPTPMSPMPPGRY